MDFTNVAEYVVTIPLGTASCRRVRELGYLSGCLSVSYRYCRNAEQPHLGITHRFPNFTWPKLSIPYSCTVHTDVLQQADFFCIREERGLHRRIRDEDEDQHPKQHSEAAEGYKHGPPPGEVTFSHMLESK